MAARLNGVHAPAGRLMMLRYLIAASMALSTTSTIAQPAPSPPSPPAIPSSYGDSIGLGDALRLIEKGTKLAEAKGFRLAFTIVEPTGELVAFARMDDTVYSASRISQQKARTAARFRMPTAEFETRVQNGRMVLLSSDEVIAVAGGLPIVANGRVIGGLGVSGATAAEDAAIAAAILSGR